MLRKRVLTAVVLGAALLAILLWLPDWATIAVVTLMVLFGVWKHGVLGVPITYTPMLWSLVFPLGMYALASLRLSLASDFPPLRVLAGAMVWVAFAAWLATFAGLGRAAWRSFGAVLAERATA